MYTNPKFVSIIKDWTQAADASEHQPALESGATMHVVGPNIRSKENALRHLGASSEEGPHMPLSPAALSIVVCC